MREYSVRIASVTEQIGIKHQGRLDELYGYVLDNQGTKKRKHWPERERVRLFATLSQRVALNVLSLSIFPSD